MNTATYNIPIELNTTGGYSVSELKEKLMAYALCLVNTPKQPKHDRVKAGEHSEWVKSMAKYRRLEPMDDKQAMLDALDERFK